MVCYIEDWKERKMQNKRPAVDSGWAWMILVASCGVTFMWEGQIKALSVLLPTLKDQFGTQTWVIGFMIALMNAVRDFPAPVVGELASVIDNRLIGIVGATMSGLAIICASFISNVQLLVVFVAVMNGIGFSLMSVTSQTLLGQYFEELYHLANGLVYASYAVGLIVFAPVAQILLATYGWRGALLLLGGINFNLLVSAVLYRQPVLQTHVASKTKDSDYAYSSLKAIDHDNDQPLSCWRSQTLPSKTESPDGVMKFSGLSFFKNFSFSAAAVMRGCLSASFTGWIVYLIPHFLVKGMSPYEASFLASAAGVAKLVGHVMYIPFVSRNIVSVRGALYLSSAVSILTLFLDKFTSTFSTILIATVLYACGIGVAFPLCDVYMKSVVDKHVLARAFGWYMATTGFLRISSGFMVGWIYDRSGSYDAGFIFLGLLQAAGVFLLAVDHFRQKARE